MTKEISYIIPAYNCAKTISNTVKSIEKYSSNINYEIIIVENGSTDNTNSIIRKIRENNSRILLEHSNKGVSQARNKGIEIANGKWIWFVDADDQISVSVKNILENNKILMADMIIGNYKKGNTLIKIVKDNALLINRKADQFRLSMIGNPTKCMTIWNKIFRLDIIKKYNIRFDERLKVAEDSKFVFKYFVESNNIFLLNKILYGYATNDDSTVRSMNVKDVDDYTFSMENMNMVFTSNLKTNHAICRYIASNFSVAMVRAIFSNESLNFFQKIKIMERTQKKDIYIKAVDGLFIKDIKSLHLLPNLCLKFKFNILAGIMYQLKSDLNKRREKNV